MIYAQEFRKFFLGTVLRKNNNWEKYGEGLEGGIKKLRNCFQKGALAGAAMERPHQDLIGTMVFWRENIPFYGLNLG